MKQIFVCLALLILCASTKAQDTTRKITVYGGLVGSGFIQVDTGEIAKWANFRIGARIQEPITKKLSFDGWLVYDPGDGTIIFRTSIKKVWKNGGISFGYQPTPVSEIKPYPLSVDGQFQFTAEAIPPGATLGTSIWYKTFKAGVYVRKGKPEYQLTYTSVDTVFSAGMWMSAQQFGGITTKLQLPLLYVMATLTGDNRQALALAVQPFKKIPYKIASDFAITKGKVTSNFLGIQHCMNTKLLADARYGIGYDFIQRSAGAFFLVGFNYRE